MHGVNDRATPFIDKTSLLDRRAGLARIYRLCVYSLARAAFS